jgi:hypothetical protein
MDISTTVSTMSRLFRADNLISGTSGNTQAIPENILAFRTITTLLQKIQQQSFTITEEYGSSKSDQALNISTAFSTVAVIDKEVVAVATRHCAERLEVIVCTNLSHDGDQPITQPFSSSFMSRIPIPSFLITKNFRKDDPEPANKDLEINDIKLPPGLEDGNEDPEQYFEERW